MDLIDSSPRQYNVIAIRKGQLTVRRTNLSAALVHEDHLIGIRVLIEIIGSAIPGCRQYDVTIIVHQYRYAALQVIIHRRNLEALQAAVLEHFFLRHLRRHIHLRLRTNDLRGRMTMIQQRIIIAESLRGEQLLAVQTAIRLAELRVALVWDLSESVVVRHGEG